MPFRKIFAILSLLVILTPPFVAWATLADDLQNEINQKRNEIRELEKQIAQYNQMLQGTKSQSATLKQQITKMEAQINKLQAEIKLTQTKISETTLVIAGLASDIQTQNIDLEKQKNNLSQILRTIDEYDQVQPFELMLKNGNLSDFLSQIQYIQNLQGSVQEKLISLKELKAQLENQKMEEENQKTALEGLKTQLRGQSSVLDNQKGEKQDLLTTTKSQEKQYQTMLTELQKKRDQIEKEIFVTEEKLRLAINPNSIPIAGTKVLAWPLQGNLTQNFGCLETRFAVRSYPACNNGSGGYHNGIDIDAELGDPIRAALNGTVSGVGNLGKYSYGKWITITHANGLVTMYGHLSAQSVSVGEKVKTGDVIGYAGSTGYSTGAHLHFTVYAANTFSIEQKWYGPVPLGGPLNPLSYL